MICCGSFSHLRSSSRVFGVIPAHLNELAPPAVRSLFPGVVYQLGMLLGAPSVGVEFALRRTFGYSWALAAFEMASIVALVVLCALGPERKGRDLGASC